MGVLLLLQGCSPAETVPGDSTDAPSSISEARVEANAPEGFRIADGFRVERLYSVPREEQGSWVSLAVDPRGRLITSDQYGPLYRVTPPPIGETGPVLVEALEVLVRDEEGDPAGRPIGGAQGLKYAFDSLYVMVAADGFGSGPGLYRLTDSTGDDQFDTAQHLLPLRGEGEHGPHSIRLSPDGERLFIVAGNFTGMPPYVRTRVPPQWDEDLLLPRLWDARGHAVGVLAPGGYIASLKPDGSDVHIHSTGYRNAYDIAFNQHGDLFAYDSDMEWDIGTPWYRPTRVNHATSGSELGWRSGSGKWPDYYPDSTPAFLDMGVGSPTAVTFGYDAAFPARYREALFLADWSFGKLDIARIHPEGSSYRAEEPEPFLSGSPLAITALRANPHDGAMYFTTGGRSSQSELYRITYVGNEPVQPMEAAGFTDPEVERLHLLRRELETFHGMEDDRAVDAAWPHLNHEDRLIRYAARVAIEHQPVDRWRDRALEASDPRTSIEAVIALARQGSPELQAPLVEKLQRLDFTELSRMERLAFLRAYQLIFTRMGEPEGDLRAGALAQLDPLFPAASREENRELSRLAVYLKMPRAVERTLNLMENSETVEDQIHYAKVLSAAETGWSPEQRARYFSWFTSAGRTRGGASFLGFLRDIRNNAEATLSETERSALAALLEVEIESQAVPGDLAAAPYQRHWSVDQLTEAVTPREKLEGVSFDQARQAFSLGACFACHRIAGQGGISGPDLTRVAQRFSVRDIAEKIVYPNTNVSDQYADTVFVLEDGSQIIGRVANLSQDSLMIITDPFAPGDLTQIRRDRIVEQYRSPLSPMPPALTNRLDEEQVRALFAFMLSAGDPEHPFFADPD